MDRWVRWRCAALIFGLLVAATPAQAGALALKRVMLSTGGVGYFEYSATVLGDASLTLDVPLDQVDDVLKSIVVYDSGGTAGEITLPGREPLAHGFADLPFDRSDFASPAKLLNALQGAEIQVPPGHPGGKPVTGRLLRVVPETARGADGLVVSRDRVILLTDAGLQQFILQDVGDVAFVDPELQQKLSAALARIAQHHSGGRRELTLTLHGKGEREVRVGYVVAAPLWKASYRLTLAADAKADKAQLQGWAVLENASGEAWHGVELTLLSGNPVTFRQPLYESYYVERPTVPVEVVGRVLPLPDTGALPQRVTAQASSLRAPQAARMMAAPAPAAPPAPPLAATEAAAANEGTTQVTFTLPEKINVPAGESLVVPIIDRVLPARRIDLYQPRTDPRHPLVTVELTNTSDSGLPPGVLTLYEATADKGARYLGDARLDTLPRGEKRLLSYAVDSRVTVDKSIATRRYIVRATIAQGVMQVTRLIRQTTNYQVGAAPGAAPPALLIEHPQLPGWSLSVPDPNTVEKTATDYRIPLALDKDGAGALAVTEDRPLEESIAIADLSDDQLAAFAGGSDFDPGLRKALAGVVSRRQTVSQRRSALDTVQQQRTRLSDDEKRLRANIAALPKESATRRHLIENLGDSEKAIDKLAGTLDSDTAALDKAEQDLRNYVSGLNL